VPYKKPILKEILAELRFASGVLTTAQYLPLLNTLVAAGFPEVEFLQVGTVAMGPTGMNTSTSPRIRCWAPERTRCVQLSDDLVVVNYTDVYPGKAPFLALVQQVVDVVQRAVPATATALRQVALVAVDELRARSGYRLGDYFVCGELLPAVLADATHSIETMTAWQAVGGGSRRVALTMQPPGTDGTTGVLLQSFFVADANGRSVVETLEGLMAESSTVFRGLMTERAQQEIMGGEL